MKPNRDCKEQTRFWQRYVSNRLEDITAAAKEAGDWVRQAGGPETAAHAAHFAIEELLTNTVQYGHPTNPSRISLELRPDVLLVHLEDDGRAFDPSKAPEPPLPKNLDERLPGGLGIHIVRQLVASLAYERRDGCNHVTLTIAR